MARHPHFDDRGTLEWYTRWDDALAAARQGGKLVFIDFGRELCSQCRSLVQAVVPSPGIAPLLEQHFVGLASDADEPEQEIIELISEHLADGMMLPFVMFTDAEGKYLAGSHGAVNPNTFRSTLEQLVAR